MALRKNALPRVSVYTVQFVAWGLVSFPLFNVCTCRDREKAVLGIPLWLIDCLALILCLCGLVMSHSYRWCHLLLYFLKEPITAGQLCFRLSQPWPLSHSPYLDSMSLQSGLLWGSWCWGTLSSHISLECYSQITSGVLFLLHRTCKGQANLLSILALIQSIVKSS